VAERPVALPPVTRERAIPIAQFLNGQNFDPETTHAMGVALEIAWPCNLETATILLPSQRSPKR
jgi:hypothetical protein